MKQFIYVNGTLESTTKQRAAEVLIKWIDNVVRHWEPKADVVRVSPNEVIINTRDGRTIRVVNQ